MAWRRHPLRTGFRGLPPRVHRKLHPWLARGERIVDASRQHWASQVRPVGVLVAALALALYTDVIAPASETGARAANAAWFLALLATLWCAWRLLNWWRDWLVVTDKRFLLAKGFIGVRLSMTPLVKITDFRFERSVMGRILGYGAFRIESAGQDQELSRLDFLRHPDELYRDVCTEMFGSPLAARPATEWSDDWTGDEGGGDWDGRGRDGGDRDGGDRGDGPDGPRNPGLPEHAPIHDDGPPSRPPRPGGGQPRRSGTEDPTAFEEYEGFEDPTREGVGYGESRGQEERSWSGTHPWNDEHPWSDERPWRPGRPVEPGDARSPHGPARSAAETIYRSDDLLRASRLADTGEIPVVIPRRARSPHGGQPPRPRRRGDEPPLFVPEEWSP